MFASDSVVTQPPNAGWSALHFATREACGICSSPRPGVQARHVARVELIANDLLRRDQPGLVQVLQPLHAHEGHGARHFLSEDVEDVRHTGRTPGTETVEIRATDAHRLRTQAQRLDDVASTPYAPVDQDLALAVEPSGDGRERIERRDRTVELATAVVRHHDSGRAQVDGASAASSASSTPLM